MIVAIDLGTTNSLIAVWQDGAPRPNSDEVAALGGAVQAGGPGMVRRAQRCLRSFPVPFSDPR